MVVVKRTDMSRGRGEADRRELILCLSYLQVLLVTQHDYLQVLLMTQGNYLQVLLMTQQVYMSGLLTTQQDDLQCP